ncbi:MAG: cupin domain-containing protein [Betaproteobacteria bacterium]|nr:cupin domain-containing protein [Betaproteobacteria bacterium]
MQGKIRRVVTGHDANGKAIVLEDRLAPAVRTNPNRPGHISVDLWRTDRSPVIVRRDEPDPTGGPRQIHPPPHGTVFRISEIAPETEAIRNMDPAKAKEVFKAMGAENASTFGQNRRHPFMHRTQTIDYAVVLEGEVVMLLDDEDVHLKAGDVVIQRGTNHAWSNRSDQPCRMLYVLIDGEFEPELKSQFGGDRH